MSAEIYSIHYDYFKIKGFDSNVKEFYGRAILPVFPKREIPLFFSHERDDIFKVKQIHNRDLEDWSQYVAAKQRSFIREMKGIE